MQEQMGSDLVQFGNSLSNVIVDYFSRLRNSISIKLIHKMLWHSFCPIRNCRHPVYILFTNALSTLAEHLLRKMRVIIVYLRHEVVQTNFLRCSLPSLSVIVRIRVHLPRPLAHVQRHHTRVKTLYPPEVNSRVYQTVQTRIDNVHYRS